VRRKILRDSARANELRDIAFRRIILSIPAGKVSTYGRVAAAAGYPLYHRAVARLLRTDPPDRLPWHRVLGAGGEIKLRHGAAKEQSARLKMEGVKFRGKRVDMERLSTQSALGSGRLKEAAGQKRQTIPLSRLRIWRDSKSSSSESICSCSKTDDR